MPLLNDADAVYFGDTPVDAVYLGDDKVWPPAGSSAGPKLTAAWIVVSDIFGHEGLLIDSSAPDGAMNVYVSYNDVGQIDRSAELHTVQPGDTLLLEAVDTQFRLQGTVLDVLDNTFFKAYGMRVKEAETATEPPDGTLVVVTIT